MPKVFTYTLILVGVGFVTGALTVGVTGFVAYKLGERAGAGSTTDKSSQTAQQNVAAVGSIPIAESAQILEEVVVVEKVEETASSTLAKTPWYVYSYGDAGASQLFLASAFTGAHLFFVGTTTPAATSTTEKVEEEEPEEQEVKKAEEPKPAPAPAKKETSENDSALLNILKSQVSELTQRITSTQTQPPPPPPTPSPSPPSVLAANQTQLPNGAIVELDAAGNIIRYVKEAPVPTEATSTKLAAPTTFEISGMKVVVGTSTGQFVWKTEKQANSKIIITGGALQGKEFASMGGFAQDHFINLPLSDFPPKEEAVYSYEIRATTGDEKMSASKSGTFRLLTRSYADVYKEVTYAADINPGLLCSQLFFLPNEFIVCVAYKAEL